MLVFSLSSPIGIAIGTVICHFSADSNGMDIAVAVLESISTGTFLFVVFIGPFLTFVSFVYSIRELGFEVCDISLDTCT